MTTKEKILEEIKDINYAYNDCSKYATIKNLLDEMDEQKTGEWIDEPNCWYRCSHCRKHYPSIIGTMEYNFCPNCGADMREEKDDG